MSAIVIKPDPSPRPSAIWVWLGLIRKDLQAFRNDPKAMFFSFIAPIFFGSLLGAIFDQGQGDSKKGKVAVLVVNEDVGDAIVKEIVESLGREDALAVRSASTEEARGQVRRGRAAAAIVFPKGFGQSARQSFFGGGDAPELVISHDPSQTTELAMIRGVLTQHAMQVISKHVFDPKFGLDFVKQFRQNLTESQDVDPARKLLLSNMMDSVARWMEDANRREAGAGAEAEAEAGAEGDGGGAPAGFRQPFRAREEAVTANSQVKYNSYAHAFAGMAMQFMLFGALEGALALLQERKSGLWRRFRSAPVSRFAVLGCRLLSATIINFSILAVCYLFAIIVFRVPIAGSVLGLLAVMIAIAVMAAAFGLMIASLGDTPEAARGLSVMAILVLVFLGGAWFPSFIFPAWAQTATRVLPTRWAMDGLESMTWRGLDLGVGLTAAGALLGFAALFGAIAWAKFRWQADQ